MQPSTVAPAGSETPLESAQGRHLVGELARRIASLGVEVADIGGNLEELATRGSGQAAQFEELHQATEAKVAGNRAIDRAAHEVQKAASAAGGEIAESRNLLGQAVESLATERREIDPGKSAPRAASAPAGVSYPVISATRCIYLRRADLEER